MAKNFTQIVISTDTFFQWLTLTNYMANAYKNVVTTATNTAGDTTSGNAFISGTFGANTMTVNYQLRGGTVDAAANLAIVSNAVFSGSNTAYTSNVYFNTSNVTINVATFSITGTGANSVTVSTNSTATNTRFVSNAVSIQGLLTVVNAASFSNSITVTGPINVTNVVSFNDHIYSSNSVNLPTGTATIVDSFNGSTYRSAKYIISMKDNGNSTYQTTEILLNHDDVTAYTTEYATIRTIANNIGTFTANLSGTTVRLWSTPTVANSTYKISRNLIVV